MPDDVVESLAGLVKQCQARFDGLEKRISQLVDPNGSSISLRKAIPGKRKSNGRLFSNIRITLSILSSIDKDNARDLPDSILSDLVARVQSFTQQIDTLANALKDIAESLGGLSSFNYDNFHATARNSQQLDLSVHFRNIYDVFEELQSDYIANLHVLKPTKARNNFQFVANALTKISERGSDSIAVLESSIEEVNKTIEGVEAAAAATSTAKDNAEQTVSELQSKAVKATQDVESITQSNNAASTLAETTEALQGKINAYSVSFTEFQNSLDERIDQHTKGNQELSRLVKSFAQQENEFSRLIEESEKMLVGSTNAGLAGHYKTMLGDLDTHLQNADWSFRLAIGFLFISTLILLTIFLWPLISGIVAISNPDLGLSLAALPIMPTSTGWQYIGQILARLVILLPAGTTVAFVMARHRNLFKLREHYAYKYSMAMSVEGFKKQSPKYKEEIAALVLEQLAFDPADNISTKQGPTGNVEQSAIKNFLNKRLGKAIDKAVDEAQKNASA